MDSSATGMKSLSHGEYAEYTNQCILARSGPVPPGRLYAYESGYGDLCFLRPMDILISRSIKMENRHLERQTDSDEQPSFPFMKLPQEVRDHIYKIVVNPTSHVDLKNRFLHIFPPHPKYSRRFICPPKPDVPETEEEQYKRINNWIYRQPLHYGKHPGREHNYYQSLLYGKLPYKQFEDIMNLSNTNSVVRKELAQVIFSRISLRLYPTAFNSFRHFLMDRPAVWSGIKEINIEVSLLNMARPREGLLNLCDCITTMLRLETLEVEVMILAKDIELFLELDEETSFVGAIRRIPVSRNFNLRFIPVAAVRSPNKVITNALRERYGQRVKEKLYPYSLMPKVWEDMTAVERYSMMRLSA